MANFNVNVGIDAGSHTSKISYDDKVIAALPGFELLSLREEAEIYFDEPVFSCVIAVPVSYTKRRREDLIFYAKKAGFKNIETINSHEAMLEALENKNQKVLIYDFGASRSEIIFFDNSEVVDSEIISDVSGLEFDKNFAAWLRERFSLDLIPEKDLLARAEKFKLALSSSDFITWRNVDITREDFERLIYFSVKRVAHTVERFINCYSPSRFIMTGGGTEIPAAKKIFTNLFSTIEFNRDLIALGSAKKASSVSSERKRKQRTDNTAKLRELHGELLGLEDLLTRKQKDRLYFLFRQAEGIFANDPALIKLLESLIKEIKAQGSNTPKSNN